MIADKTLHQTARAKNPSAMVVRFGANWEIVVPSQINLLTPYVLLEQENWFERELEFIKSWLRPGMRVIDVGANYGVYTVSMANQVGSKGAVWAFEPCRQTFEMLRRSIVHNEFDQAVLIKAALGADFANVRLATGENSELNRISDVASATSETVDLTTLDYCADKLEFGDVDLIKLDAEGYEVQVVSGAKRLLNRCSPLIMFEFKHNDSLNFDLLEKFESLGYSIYVLIPGINALTPYCQTQHNDLLLINLFACKDDRAQLLQRDGYLINVTDPPCMNASRKNRLRSSDGSFNAVYATAASQVQVAENSDIAPERRLQAALFARATVSDVSPDCLWSQSLLARLCSFLGNTAAAAQVAAKILPRVRQMRTEPPHEIMPASDRYDAIEPAQNRRDWFAASVHECFEHSRGYSSYMLGTDCLANLHAIESLGFSSPYLERRRQLVHRLAGLSPVPTIPQTLLHPHDDNKNHKFWQQLNLKDQDCGTYQ